MKWRRGVYEIMTAPDGVQHRIGWLHESELFAVEKRRNGICITHLPTGFLIPEAPRTVTQAKKICEYLVQKPRLWAAGYQFGKWPSYSNAQKDRRIKRLAEAVAAANE